ncbi:MAG: HAMP domain-containing histidine kinase [Clostridia bacterium]|nr:HAMP domain-containing histidine kinase [Clostridia bacterium]
MNQARKKFVIFAMLAVLVLLTVLLAIINGINFTMVAEDADQITKNISGGRGSFREEDGPLGGYAEGWWGPMGPHSPELRMTIRYFTVRVSEEGEKQLAGMNISAFTNESALETAEKLLKGSAKSGWFGGIYRYRVAKEGKDTYVTVVDMAREMLPAYRTLLISAIGELVGLAVCLAFLIFISRRLFRPLEEADRKQRLFLAEAEKEFQVPLTIIDANAEMIEKESGSSDWTQSIRRQTRKMGSLTRKIGALALFEGEEQKNVTCPLSAIVLSSLRSSKDALEKRSLRIESDVDPYISVSGDPDALSAMVSELLENSRKFALSFVRVSLKEEDRRVLLTVTNDAEISEDDVEAVFDRFVRLSNARGIPGDGLGLSRVRDAVRLSNGRITALYDKASREFSVQISL